MDDTPILPPIPVIRDRLARIQRERRRLRTLLRWVVRDQEERARQAAPEPRQQAAGREGGHED